MNQLPPQPSITWRELFVAWGKILVGRAPLLSIEVTKECPLACPGCYAYGSTHLGGPIPFRALHDLRGEALVERVLRLVRTYKPMHVSLVGGEPLVRHHELSRILPVLAQMRIFSLVVTSAVIPIPVEWMKIPRVRVAVSVDGLPEDHDVRRKPATYDRILKNITGCEVNIHWVITRTMLRRASYLEEYVKFWNARPEVKRIWVSLYTPQIGEHSAEKLALKERECVAHQLTDLAAYYPKLLINKGVARSLVRPPKNPDDCLFAKMSTRFSADLSSRVDPCVFGGTPDCSQCGCAISSGLHWIRNFRIVGPLSVDHLVQSSRTVGVLVNQIRLDSIGLLRWAADRAKPCNGTDLVQIHANAALENRVSTELQIHRRADSGKL